MHLKLKRVHAITKKSVHIQVETGSSMPAILIEFCK